MSERHVSGNTLGPQPSERPSRTRGQLYFFFCLCWSFFCFPFSSCFFPLPFSLALSFLSFFLFLFFLAARGSRRMVSPNITAGNCMAMRNIAGRGLNMVSCCHSPVKLVCGKINQIITHTPSLDNAILLAFQQNLAAAHQDQRLNRLAKRRIVVRETDSKPACTVSSRSIKL